MAEAPLLLHEWTDFYVIVGSSAGALTGLQFVVVARIAEARAARSMLEIRAFGTPTIVDFHESDTFKKELDRLRQDFAKPFTPLGEEEETTASAK